MSGPPTDTRQAGRTLAILGYHKIGPPPPGGWETWYYVPEATFAAHLQYLRDDGWAVLDAATLLDGLTDPDRLPARSALLTFDDGYRSFRTFAVPQLLRYGAPAVLFVPTDFIGGTNTFDADTAEPVDRICDWDDLRAVQVQGVSVQSHGVTHRAFSGLGPAEREAELARSKLVLQAGLGRPVEMFSFPYGDDGSDPDVAREMLIRNGYRAACIFGGGPVFLPDINLYRLSRLAVGTETDLHAALHPARYSDRQA